MGCPPHGASAWAARESGSASCHRGLVTRCRHRELHVPLLLSSTWPSLAESRMDGRLCSTRAGGSQARGALPAQRAASVVALEVSVLFIDGKRTVERGTGRPESS